MRDVLFHVKKLPKSLIWIFLVPVFYGLGHWLESQPEAFEKYYAGSLQKSLMQGISTVTGGLPFSLAEVLFVGHGIALVVVFATILVRLVKGGALKLLYQTVVYLSVVYVVFMMIWGLNYGRQPLAVAMGLEVRPYAVEELYALTSLLVDQANQLREGQSLNDEGVMTLSAVRSVVFSRAALGYEPLGEDYTIFRGSWGPPKAVWLSEAMLYTGITGIFMPFTGEANVNIRVPDLLLPAIALHEKAHQMGIAREDEANYAAYLACMSHPDADFQYSGAVLALIHATNALYRDDPEAYFELRERYSEGLRKDLAAYSAFWKPYQGKVNDTADQINDTYLKTNRQVDGVKSYGRMVDLLLADFLSDGEIKASVNAAGAAGSGR